MNSVTADTKYRYSMMRYAEKYGVARPMRPLQWLSPTEKLSSFTVQDV